MISNVYITNDDSKAVHSDRLLTWYDSESVDYPWRQDWLKWKSPYHVWLSEIMLQQTTITAVLPKYVAFTQKLPTIQRVAEAGEEQIRELVQGLGYYRRFALFHKAAKIIAEQNHWPQTFEEWLHVPGVGSYTAAAVSSITLSAVVGVVDGNVERVLSRIYAIPGPVNAAGKKHVFQILVNKLIPKIRPGDFNQALMQLGQLVCRPSAPLCKSCPFSSICAAYKFHSYDVIPAPKIKKTTISVRLRILITANSQQIMTHKRPARARFLGGQLGLPTFIFSDKKETWILDGEPEITLNNLGLEVIGKFTHSITHHKILVEVVKARVTPSISNSISMSVAETKKKLISSLDLKALRVASLN